MEVRAVVLDCPKGEIAKPELVFEVLCAGTGGSCLTQAVERWLD